MTSREIGWLRTANAGDFAMKRSFYHLKASLLAEHGESSGFDLQTVDHACWSCGGTGWWKRGVECLSCDNSGIHHTTRHWLRRWHLGDHLFHTPSDTGDNPVREIDGLIVHPNPPTAAVAERCYARLLLRHRPLCWWREFGEPWFREGINAHAMHAQRLARLVNERELFPVFTTA